MSRSELKFSVDTFWGDTLYIKHCLKQFSVDKVSKHDHCAKFQLDRLKNKEVGIKVLIFAKSSIVTSYIYDSCDVITILGIFKVRS